MNNKNDVLASSGLSSPREAESVRQGAASLYGELPYSDVTEECGNCRFYIHGDAEVCRAHPPTAWAGWPRTKANLWCGEYEPTVEKSQPDVSHNPGEANP